MSCPNLRSDKFSFWLSLPRFYSRNCRLCGHVDWNRGRTSIGYCSIGLVLETKAETQKTLVFRFVFSCLHQEFWYDMVWCDALWRGMIAWVVMLLLYKEDTVVMNLESPCRGSALNRQAPHYYEQISCL